MNRDHLSASNLDRVMACPASAILPQWKKPGSGGAQRGTIIHAYMEDVATVGRGTALDNVHPDFRDECAAIDVSHLHGWAPHVEEAFALTLRHDGSSARSLSGVLQAPGSRYPAMADDVLEIPGRLDLFDAGRVDDYKTGHGTTSHYWQMRFAQLAVWHVYGWTPPARTLHLQPDGTWLPRVVAAPLNTARGEDKAIAWLMHATLERVERYRREHRAPDKEDIKPGEHCKYCPAKQTCPAYTNLIQVAAGIGPDGVVQQAWGKNKADAWDLAQQMKDAAAQLEDDLKAMAVLDEIKLNNGKVLRQVMKEGNEYFTDISRVLGEVRALAPAGDVARIVKESLTKTAIREYLDRRVDEPARVNTALLQKLRDMGLLVKGAAKPAVVVEKE